VLGYAATPSEGAPIEIGWKHTSCDQISIEYFDFVKERRGRRSRKELILPSAVRDLYLLGEGYPFQKLVAAAEETQRIRKSRQSNMKASSMEKFRGLFTKAFDNSKPTTRTAKTA